MQRLTRRTLLGAGAVAAGGAAAVAAGQDSRGRRWLHNLGIIDGPDLAPPVTAATVEWTTLRSRHRRADVEFGLYVPDRPAALLVCLHGRNADHRFAFDSLGIHHFVAARALPFVVASADGGPASYWHPRADGTDALSMVFDELLPLVVDRVGGALPVAVIGWSMGGYGALLAGSTWPSRVEAIAAAAPAVWRSYAASAPGAFDSESDFAAHDVFARASALSGLPVALACGVDDPFVGNVRALASSIQAARLSVRDGFHDAATWRSFLPGQLDFIARSLAHADGMRSMNRFRRPADPPSTR